MFANMIFPPGSVVSSGWKSNPQQTTSNIGPSSAVVAGEGGLLQHGPAMAEEALVEGDTSTRTRPMSISERARLLRIPKPEPGLKCPRCGSTNTKFGYFNNYSFAQPRHLCRDCHRYWTRGGVLRDIPVGAPCRRRRRAKGNKYKAAASSAAATAASASATPATTSSSTSCTVNEAPILQATVSSMHTTNLCFNSSCSGAATLLVDSAGRRAISGMEQQWGTQSQMHRFPVFSHAMDYNLGPAISVPVTMATPSMFHPGLESGGDRGVRGGDEGQFHVMPINSDVNQYPIWAMHAHVNGYTASYPNCTADLRRKPAHPVFLHSRAMFPVGCLCFPV
ncbi:unnamed protein product [Urochloa decumbens]|uniref:Dof zinc finger protein n=1 Tax=Urochloa decumbens TaxID=240449 RepID=A0ABC9B3T9_9POAL